MRHTSRLKPGRIDFVIDGRGYGFGYGGGYGDGDGDGDGSGNGSGNGSGWSEMIL